jgi:hypothetical protein
MKWGRTETFSPPSAGRSGSDALVAPGVSETGIWDRLSDPVAHATNVVAIALTGAAGTFS